MIIKYDTIIVGGGIAGLCSAAYLSRAGQKVLLLEKNKECGGLVSSFTMDGFLFEGGVRALENAGIIFPMLEDLGIKLETVKSKVSLGIGDEIINITEKAHLADYKDLLLKLYPQSKDEIEKFIPLVEKIIKQMDVLYGVENPMFKDIKNDREYLFGKLLPWFPKFLMTVRKINQMNVPVEPYLEKIISDTSLRDMITQHFFKSTPAFFALSYFSLYIDYFYPIHGVGDLSRAVYDKAREYGTTIITECSAKEINAVTNQITDDKGNIYNYDNLIWAADLKYLYNNTKIEGLSDKIISKFNTKKDQLDRCKGNDTVFTLYLEVDAHADTFQKISNGHFFYSPKKEGLGDTHRGELRAMLDNWSNTNKSQVIQWVDKYIELNTYEISIPALKNPAHAPEGKCGLIISILAEYELFEKVKEDGWYEEFKSLLEDKIISVLSEAIYPQLKGNIIKKFSFTPLTIKERIASTDGAIIGWSFEGEVPVVHKLQYSDTSVLTPIPNIYQAGQWAYSPAGVPMSILTGKLATNRILKKK